MTYPNLARVDERVLAALRDASRRDPQVLHNGEHLQALLADLAPDLPTGMLEACVAVARTNATRWLVQSPPYSEDQVVAWLRAQYPNLSPDSAAKAVAAFAILAAAGPERPAPQPPAPDRPTLGSLPTVLPGHPSGPTPAAPVSAPTPPPTPAPIPAPISAPTPAPTPPPTPAPVVDQPTVTGMPGPWPGYAPTPPAPPAPPPAPPWTAAPSTPRRPRRRLALVLAIVAILLAGGGIGAWLVIKGGGKPQPLAAPQHVSAHLDGFGAVRVSWRPVPGADHYWIYYRAANQPGSGHQLANGTSYTFPGLASSDNRFVVQAYTADGQAGRRSVPVAWKAHTSLTAPTNVSVKQNGFDLDVTWSPVAHATGYLLSDSASSGQPTTVHGTSYTVSNAVYSTHSFVVKAVAGSTTGPANDAGTWTPANTLSTAEATLAYKLPGTVAAPGSCSADTGTEQKYSSLVTAVIRCDPIVHGRKNGPAYLYADQLAAGRQKAFERSFYGAALQTDKAGCANSYPDSGTHSVWWIGSAKNVMGDEFCFATSESSSFAWTYYRENVVIQVEGPPPTTRNGLHAWWLAQHLDLRS